MPIQRTATGIAIEEARRRRGWKHKDLVAQVLKHPQLGKRYRFSEGTLRHVESGRVGRPSVLTQFAIATVLDLDVIDLWPAEDE